MKKFAVNFGVSLAAYFVMNVISLVLGIPLQIINFWGVYAIFHTVAIAFLYFLLGIGLNSLGKHWLDYLSVCGSFIISLLLMFLFGFVHEFNNTSFVGMLHIASRRSIDVFIFGIALTPLPSIFIWFGMVYKSSKLKKKQSEMTD